VLPEQRKRDSTWHTVCFSLLVGPATEVPAEAAFARCGLRGHEKWGL